MAVRRQCSVALLLGLGLCAAAGGGTATLAAQGPGVKIIKGTPKASVTVGTETFAFNGGRCAIGPDSFGIITGQIADGQHFELNVPNMTRPPDPAAIKPTKDGTYTNASLTVIPARGKNWHAGGRSRREEGELTVVLKNNRMAGEFSGRTDGSPRLEIKGSFSC